MFSNLKHNNGKTSTWTNRPNAGTYPSRGFSVAAGAEAFTIKGNEAERLVRCKHCGFICDKERDVKQKNNSWAGFGINQGSQLTADTSIGDRRVMPDTVVVNSANQLIIGGRNPLAQTTNRFISLMGGFAVLTTTHAANSQIITTAGTLKNFRFTLNGIAPPKNGSYTLTLYVNGSATSVTATMSAGQMLAEDTTNTASVVAGDTVSLLITFSGWTPPTASAPYFCTEFVPTIGGETLFMGNCSGSINSSQIHQIMSDGTNVTIGDSAESSLQQIIPCNGTLKNFYVVLTTAPGAGTSFTFTVEKNRVATALAVTVSDTASTGNNTSTSLSVSAGDLLCFTIAKSGSPATGTMQWGFTFVPEGAGDFPLMYNDTGLTTGGSTNDFGPMNSKGFLVSNAPSSNKSFIQPCVIKAMYAWSSVAPGDGASYTFTLCLKQQPTPLNLVISGTVAETAASTVLSEDNYVRISETDFPNTKIAPSGSAARSRVKVSYLARMSNNVGQKIQDSYYNRDVIGGCPCCGSYTYDS